LRERGYLVSVFIVICILLVAFPVVNIYFIYPAFENLIAYIKEDEAVKISNHLASMFVSRTGKPEFSTICLRVARLK